MNINELDLSEFEYLGSEIHYPSTEYVGYLDYFIFNEFMVCVAPSIYIKFYDSKMSLTYEENLYSLKIIDGSGGDIRKGAQMVTKHIDFARNYSDIMNNNVRNIIGKNDLELLYKTVVRRKIIEGLL